MARDKKNAAAEVAEYIECDLAKFPPDRLRARGEKVADVFSVYTWPGGRRYPHERIMGEVYRIPGTDVVEIKLLDETVGWAGFAFKLPKNGLKPG